jgi:photosystem II stability/assembly factor-like uncharacterized protein
MKSYKATPLFLCLFILLLFSCKKDKVEMMFTELESGIDRDLNSICFVNDTTGYVCGGDRYFKGDILCTINGGKTWQPQGTGLDKALYKIFFQNSDTGFTGGYDGKIYRTQNGGEEWTLYQSPLYIPVRDLVMIDDVTGYGCGGDGFQSGCLYKTIDGGNSWTYDTSDIEFRSILFVNDQTGFAGWLRCAF